MHPYPKTIIILLALSLLVACAPAAAPIASPTAGPVTLRVMTHDSFSASEAVVQAFEQANNVKLEFIKSGDAGSMLNRAVLTKSSPQADVIYGVDNTFLSRALDEGVFEPYVSPALADIPASLQMDASHSALPVDYGDVCINYDKAWFSAKGLALPQSLADLTKPEYKDLLVTENPATSSTGLAFLLATIAQYGVDGYLPYWQSLKANSLVVVNDWEAAYYTNFSGSSGKGAQPMVVSYGTSPAAEVYYADPPVKESPTASLVGNGMCFRQVEFVGILKGTPNRALAEKFVDYMLSTQFQEDIPLQMFVFPANSKATVPQVFTDNIQKPDQPATLDPAVISANRDAWLSAFTEQILK
jgi:thiamine transport system substrate-binding protein